MHNPVFYERFRKSLHNRLRTAALFSYIKSIISSFFYIHFPHEMRRLSKSYPESFIALLQLAFCTDQICDICRKLQHHRILAGWIGNPGHSGLPPDPVPSVSGDPVDMLRRLLFLRSISHHLHILGYMIRMNPCIFQAAGKDKPVRRDPQHTEKAAAGVNHPDLRPCLQKSDAPVQIADQCIRGNSVQFLQVSSFFPFPHFSLICKQAAASPSVFSRFKKRRRSLPEQNIKRQLFSRSDVRAHADSHLKFRLIPFNRKRKFPADFLRLLEHLCVGDTAGGKHQEFISSDPAYNIRGGKQGRQ